MQKEQYELEIVGGKESVPAASMKEYEKKIEEYGKRLKRYEDEKAGIKKDAEKFEQERDEAQKHSGAFGIAVIYLQITILLSSIAALMKKKPIYYLALATGVWGLVAFANGFWLFM